MKKSKKIEAIPAESGVQAAQWPELSEQWQAAGQEWADWWSRAVTGGAANAAPLGSAVDPGLTLPALPAAPIPSDALTDITRRYQQRLEALWSRIVVGDSPAFVPEAEDDRRFAAKAWREQPYFALLKDAYLLYSDYVRELTDVAQADPDTKKKLAFVANQYINAIAPSNFLATNPDALQLALSSQGASIAQGASNLIADAQRGRASVAVGVTNDLTGAVSAVDLVNAAVAALGGQGGGGRPDMAQGGGPDGARALSSRFPAGSSPDLSASSEGRCRKVPPLLACIRQCLLSRAARPRATGPASPGLR